MATFLFDGDELRQCPYNVNHRVLSRRLLAHMNKCAAEPDSPDLIICQYNSLHRIYPHEFNAHIVECPDNRQAIRELMNPSTTKVDNPTNNSQSQIDGWEPENGDQPYVLEGLQDDKEKEQTKRNSSFIAQHRLYGLKPAERKRIYNQITEDVIRRKAQYEREELTESEASELGLTVERPKFEIDTNGNRPSSSSQSSSSSRNSETRADRKPTIKRPADEDDEDNKEEVRKLIRSQADCFKTRKSY